MPAIDRRPVAVRETRPPVDGVLDAIGDTPLVRLRRLADRSDIEVFAKLEASNPGASVKARPAARMIQDALDAGFLRPGSTVVESSSGNMGVGLAQACRFHDLSFICVADSRANEVTVQTMRALGADVRIVTEPDPATGDLLTARLRLVAELVAEIPGAYWPDQYASRSNPAAHAAGTMREIDEALDGDLDYLFIATSTTGTLNGCADYLRRHRRDTKVIAVDAVGSALFGGRRGPRSLPGFGAGMQTELSRRAGFDELVRVSDVDCVVGARRLIEREAVFAGASSGGVAAAFASLLPAMTPGSRSALLFADGGVGYLSTVYDDGWVERELGVGRDEMAALIAGDAPTVAVR